MRTDAEWMSEAIALAEQSARSGGGPFGALVVREGELLGRGSNRVTEDLDPTAHAEVVAIRDACRRIGDFSLAGATVYASCEPCPLCTGATLWSRAARVVYAADRHDAARAGFDDAEFFRMFDLREQPDLLVRERLSVPEAGLPFEVWEANPDRIRY